MGAYEFQIPDLDVPNGCSFTYSVSSIAPITAISDGSSFMTKLPKGVSWPANTAFNSGHVGTYEITVITHPEACTLDSQKFTIELIECMAD